MSFFKKFTGMSDLEIKKIKIIFTIFFIFWVVCAFHYLLSY